MEEGRGSGWERRWEKASVLIRERWGKGQWRRRGGAGGGVSAPTCVVPKVHWSAPLAPPH